MDISFQTRKLEKTFNSARKLEKTYGQRRAKAIMHRLAILREAESLDQVPVTPPDRRHQLHGDRAGQYAVDLVHPYRLVFTPHHDPVPRKEDGDIDTAGVTVITILDVIDYH